MLTLFQEGEHYIYRLPIRLLLNLDKKFYLSLAYSNIDNGLKYLLCCSMIVYAFIVCCVAFTL